MSADRYRIGSAPDWRGNLIGEGDVVLYPRADGRSVEIREATVLEVWRRVEDRTEFIWETSEHVQVAAYVYKLLPTGRSSRFGRWGDPSPVWIQNGENVTRV